MKKGKRILALLGVILLVALYALTIIAAIFDHTATQQYLMTAILATIFVPVMIWVYQLIYRVFHKDDSDEE